MPDRSVFAANDQSQFYTPVILKALPRKWRGRLAVAMGMDFFEPYFHPEHHTLWEHLTTGGLYRLAALFFNGFPLSQKEPVVRQTLRYMGELATDGVSILIFPEGHRTEHGEIKTFQPGVAMIASKLGLPVVPVRLEGIERVLHHTWRWPRRGDVRVDIRSTAPARRRRLRCAGQTGPGGRRRVAAAAGRYAALRIERGGVIGGVMLLALLALQVLTTAV